MNPYLLVTDSLILRRRVYSESSRKNSCVVRTCQHHSQLVRPFDLTQRPSAACARSRHHLGREAGWKEVLYQTGESNSNEWNQFVSHRVVHSLDKEPQVSFLRRCWPLTLQAFRPSLGILQGRVSAANNSFGWAEDVKPSCCSQCRAEGMVKLRGPKCRCGRAEPVFGMLGDARSTCCSKCKADGIVDIKNRKCQCGKAQPYFGFPNDARATCCSKCKQEGMVDIRNRKCECGAALPYYGYASDARATCCSKCKHDGMVDVKNLRCNCGKARPSFGFTDDVRPTCCKQCMAAGMVNIRSPKCKVCKKQAHYPDEAGRPKQLCAVHSAEVGAHVLSSSRRSRMASECFDALEAEWGHKLPFRYRFDIKTGTWSGEEFAGLVPRRNLQPDAYDPEARKVVEFLGNYFHGFPPEHPQQFRLMVCFELTIVPLCSCLVTCYSFCQCHFGFRLPRHDSFVCVGGRPAAELHAETMARLDLFLSEGLEVVYMWEYDFVQWQREATRRPAEDAVFGVSSLNSAGI